MDSTIEPIEIIASLCVLLVILFSLIAVVRGFREIAEEAIQKDRCPNCGKLWATEVVRKEMSDEGYIYLVERQDKCCRYCGY